MGSQHLAFAPPEVKCVIAVAVHIDLHNSHTRPALQAQFACSMQCKHATDPELQAAKQHVADVMVLLECAQCFRIQYDDYDDDDNNGLVQHQIILFQEIAMFVTGLYMFIVEQTLASPMPATSSKNTLSFSAMYCSLTPFICRCSRRISARRSASASGSITRFTCTARAAGHSYCY